MVIQITLFPRAHPTNPPLSLHHSKLPEAPITNWSQQASVEDAEESDSDENEEGCEDDEEVMEEENTPWTHSPFTAEVFVPALDQGEAAVALADLRLVIAPLCDAGVGHKNPKLDLLLHSCLEKVRMFLWMYTDPNNPCGWQDAFLRTAKAYEKGGWLAG